MSNVHQQSESVLEKKLDLLLRTGQMLMQSGADSNRIDRNVKRMAAYFGIPADKLHMHITFTTLMMSVSDGSNSITKFKKMAGHGINMTIVDGISKLTWRALEEQYSLEMYQEELDKLSSKKHFYPRWLILLAVGLGCGGFCTLFGGDWQALLIATGAAATGLFVRQELHKRHVNNYMTVAAAALVSTIITSTIALYTNWTSTPQDAIAGAVLFLIPGVPLINSLDDMIDGFTIVGVTRGIVTILTVISIAFGMIVVMKIFGTTNIPLTAPVHNKLAIVFAGALAAAGFAVLFNVPLRTLGICALGGAIAVLTRNILRDDCGFTLPLASLCGGLLSSTCAIFWVHTVHTPGHVITIPPMIPMVPGVKAYTAMMGMFGLIGNGTDKVKAMEQMITPGIEFMLTIFCLALAVAIPNIIDRHFSSKKKQRRIEMALQQQLATSNQ